MTSEKKTVQGRLHTVTLNFDAETAHKANAIYHAIRVEKEPNNTVQKYCCVEGSYVKIILESPQLKALRSSSNGLLDILKLLSEVTDNFDLKSPSIKYDHF
ncbi:uncharacterized protein LOC126902023 [Daktulosphaira vitifoliae]|uniref:uncharacterized protein LOC126902023 n=1 Tax=Daktulosphaira vitifoliae TaxID=58002 RepID=UPI0021AA1725|nr:uncharacterized protein LOC126902023 [Daktulosphaira vitifoliae]